MIARINTIAIFEPDHHPKKSLLAVPLIRSGFWPNWSGFLSKVRIFQKSNKISHRNGFFRHFLIESVMINFTLKVRKSQIRQIIKKSEKKKIYNMRFISVYKYRKRLFSGRLPENKKLFSGRLPENKKLFSGIFRKIRSYFPE